MLDIYEKESYNSDTELFLKYLLLLKLSIRSNKLFQESLETKARVYTFIEKRFFENQFKMEIIKAILGRLLEIALEIDEVDFSVALNAASVSSSTAVFSRKPITRFLIKDSHAISSYFTIITHCFVTNPEKSNKDLLNFLLYPLEMMQESIMNNITLTQMNIQNKLLKILKRATVLEFQEQISRHIGKLSSVHTTAQQMQLLLRKLAKYKSSANDETSASLEIPITQSNYVTCLLSTLIDMISGDSIKSFFYFDGNLNSFITLKSPLEFNSIGFCFTGFFRTEITNYNSPQCLLCLLKMKPTSSKGVELLIDGTSHKLTYKMFKRNKGIIVSAETIIFDKCEIRPDRWHKITFAQISNEIILQFDNERIFKEAKDKSCLARSYNVGAIGASINSETKEAQYLLVGETSTWYFFSSGEKLVEAFSDLASKGDYIRLRYRKEGVHQDNFTHFPEPSMWRDLKYFQKEFITTTVMIIEPKVRDKFIYF